MPGERMCWFCPYMVVEQGSPEYSEYTPGYPPSIYCIKGNWGFGVSGPNLEVYNPKTLKQAINMAKKCNDYEEREE